MVMGAVLGFVFLGKWGQDYLLESSHPECASISNCTGCSGACGWCSMDGEGHCSALCTTQAGECGDHMDDRLGSGGGFYWPMLFFVWWFPCCGYYGYGGYRSRYYGSPHGMGGGATTGRGFGSYGVVESTANNVQISQPPTQVAPAGRM